MKINYYDFVVLNLIDELGRTMDFYKERHDLEIKKEIDKEIEKKLEWFEKEKQNAGDDDYYVDCLIDEYQEFIANQRFRQYNELSSYFQKVYARFENQIATYREFVENVKKRNVNFSAVEKIDFSKYTKVQEMNWAVNVMKHAKGPSLKNLQDCNSKYVQDPVEFKELSYGCFSDKILNIEFFDIEEFVDEAKTVWFDVYEQNKKLREESAKKEKEIAEKKIEKKEVDEQEME